MSDYSEKYNTPLGDGEEFLYQAFLNALPEYQRNVRDYDMQGYAKSVNFIPPEAQGHFTDEFKKPNHPTFSSESMYNGADGHYGGFWSDVGGMWTFFPSEWNKQFIDGYKDDTATIMR